MKIQSVSITNYRGISELSFRPNRFNCFIGENNAGKSSLLLALKIFFSGTTLKETDFHNKDNEVIIEVSFEEVVADDLNRITDEGHRERITPYIVDGELSLARVYATDGKSKLKLVTNIPIDTNLRKSNYDLYLKNKKKADFQNIVASYFPNFSEYFEEMPSSLAAFKGKIEEIVSNLAPELFERGYVDLPSGIPASILNLLPETLLIPAVKDLNDEVKTKDAATFGRLLNFLISQLEDTEELSQIQNAYNTLQRLLNITQNEDGTSDDNRLQQLQRIEQTVQNNLNSHFSHARLEIEVPQPELKQLLNTASIFIDDGIRTNIDVKGDGVKRSLIFALLKTFVELSVNRDDDQQTPYVLLFEEPELYLHPKAQKILFNALETMSHSHVQVFVTTHSPNFLSPEMNGNFYKIWKNTVNTPPSSELMDVDLQSISVRDLYLIMCYENNGAALFAQKVILVEGASETIYIKHLAKRLNPHWDIDLSNIQVVEIGGKYNVKKYIEFFNSFDIQAFALVDRDFLIDGINQVDLSPKASESKDLLYNFLDSEAERLGLSYVPNSKTVKLAKGKRTWAEQYLRLKELYNSSIDRPLNQDEIEDFNTLFASEVNDIRRTVMDSEDFDVSQLNEILDVLKSENVFTLKYGAIEEYYPSNVTGNDKPSKALCAVGKLYDSRDWASVSGDKRTELTAIFRRIFA